MSQLLRAIPHLTTAAAGLLRTQETDDDPHKRWSRCYGITVRWWREFRDMSQEDLAGVTGLSRGCIGYVETGRSSPSAETQSRLALGLGVSILEMDAQTDRRFRAGE